MMKARFMSEVFVGRCALASVLMSATLMLGIVGAGGTAHAASAVTLSPEVTERGAALFVKNCIMCHERGMEHPGTAALSYLYGKDKGALADRDNLTPDFVRYVVRHGRGLMPGFRVGELNEEELKMLAEYLSAGPHPATMEK